MARLWLATGVVRGEGNELAVFADSTGMQVKVPDGTAWVEGQACLNDAQVTLAVGAADASNPRIDRVVLRKDSAANTFALLVLAGTPAASPVAPTLTQSATVWEVPLAQVLVPATATTINSGNVTDERPMTANVGLAAVQTLYNKTLITPTIASFVNAQHNHQSAAGGGALNFNRYALLAAGGFTPADTNGAPVVPTNSTWEIQFPSGAVYTAYNRDALTVPPSYTGTAITFRIKGYSPTSSGSYTLNLLAAAVADGSPPYPALPQVATAAITSHATAGGEVTWTLTWSSGLPSALQDLQIALQRPNSGTADTLRVKKVLVDFGS